MQISIAMATYNGQKYLQEQLNSLISQTLRPNELVVCDDGSSDRTLEILREFSNVAPFSVRVIPNDTKLGYVKNFEKAVAMCSGDVIFLSDQDDVWLKNKVEDIVADFERDRSILLVQSDLVLVDGQLRRLGSTVMEGLLASGRSSRELITGCGLAFRKIFLPLVLPFPDKISAHDTWLNEFADALSVRAVEEIPLTLYRRHDENVSQLAADTRGLQGVVANIRQHLATSEQPAWGRRVLRLREMRRRIEEMAGYCYSISIDEDQLRAAMFYIEQELGLQLERIEIVSRSRLSRMPAALYFWKKRGYERSAGVKSLVKDLIRKKVTF